MKTLTKRSITLLVMTISGGLALLACGSPDPIPVYVTPTPIPTTAVAPTPAPIAADTLVNAVPTQSNMTLVPSPFAQPGVQYGPITGDNYTPEPRYTPLPQELHVRPCPVTITAPQVTLYTQPNPSSQSTGTAAERQKLTVSEVITAGDGTQWANTDGGWLLLDNQAALGSMRACQILLGNEPDTTLLGLHVLNWSSQNEILALAQRLVDIGHPMSTIKGLTGSEGTLEKVKAISPQTTTIYRSIIHGTIGGDCPNGNNDPVEEARIWQDDLETQWSGVTADYYELSNECGADLDWIVTFSIESMRIASERGRCLLLFSFPGGNPELNMFGQLLPVYQYALEHPCQPGRYHGIAMHAYSVWSEGRISEKDVWLAFRHRLIYQFLLENLPEAATKIPVFYTELGQGSGFTIVSCEDITRDMIQYTYQLEEDPYVKGFDVWNVGTDTGIAWLDLTECLPLMGDALVDYYTGG